MSPRKLTARGPTKGRSAEGSPPASTDASRVLIRFEQMEGRFDAVLDAVTLNRRVLEDKIEQSRAELKSDIDVLTVAVRHNTERIDKNSEEIRFLSGRVDKHSEEIRLLSGRVDKHSEEIRLVGQQMERLAQRADLTLLEHRVTALERRAGLAPG